MNFDSLGLAPALLRALAEKGYKEPSTIQAAAIPVALTGNDVMAAAQTGTGKTAAFVLPMLERLFPNGERSNPNRLTPTRELAMQVHDSMREYGKFLHMHSTTIFGGVGMGPQIQSLRRGVDVLIATPGRLIDHMQRGNADLSGIEILVLDEADRMLDMGFLPALKQLLAVIPKKRQTMLFSATFADPIKALARQFTQQPREIQITPPNSVVATVTHRVHPVDADRKRDLLLHLLAEDSRRQALVFARTKHGADKLCRYLDQSGLRTAAIHGNKSQSQRTRALKDFKNGKITILVATDIAARGLDIEQLPLVVNFDLPMVAEDYVHRIGRTGRAGAKGLAVSLVSQEETGLLVQIQKLLKQDIQLTPVDEFAPTRPLRMDSNAKPKQGGRTKQPQNASRKRRPQAQAPQGKAKRSPSHEQRRSSTRGKRSSQRTR